jgi:SAM-dependent methyltransferase
MYSRAFSSIVVALLVPSVSSAQRAPGDTPFVATPPAVVTAMLETAGVGPADLVYDLGSGDGRIVIAAAARFGARGVGVEIDGDLVRLARENARRAGVADRVEFIERDLFLTDLREASVVTLYLLPIVNFRLQPKLLEELRPGSRVVSHAFDMANWPPDMEFQVAERWVFFWIVPARLEGEWSLRAPTGAPEITLSLSQRFQRFEGSAGSGAAEQRVEEGLISGAEISFRTSAREGGSIVRRWYTGTVEGDSIRGRVVVDGGEGTGIHPWEASRRTR